MTALTLSATVGVLDPLFRYRTGFVCVWPPITNSEVEVIDCSILTVEANRQTLPAVVKLL